MSYNLKGYWVRIAQLDILMVFHGHMPPVWITCSLSSDWASTVNLYRFSLLTVRRAFPCRRRLQFRFLLPPIQAPLLRRPRRRYVCSVTWPWLTAYCSFKVSCLWMKCFSFKRDTALPRSAAVGVVSTIKTIISLSFCFITL